MLDTLDKISHDLSAPETRYGWFQMSPAPPAREVMEMTAAVDVTSTSTGTRYIRHITHQKSSSLYFLFLGFWVALTDLGHEEPLELVGRNQENGKLNEPKDQVAEHLLRRHTNAFGYGVGNVQVGGPDGADHLGHGGRAGIRLNGVPEEGGDGSSDDGKLGEVPSKRGSGGDGVRDVQTSSDEAVEDEGDGADKTAEYDGDNGFSPGMTSVRLLRQPTRKRR